MGCGGSKEADTEGPRWDDAKVAEWEGEGVVRFKLSCKWGVEQDKFNITAFNAKGEMAMAVTGTTHEGIVVGRRGKNFVVSFSTPTDVEMQFEPKNNEIRRKLRSGSGEGLIREVGEAVLTGKNGMKKKPGVTRWTKPKEDLGSYTDISKAEDPGSSAAMPKIFSVGRVMKDRIVAFEGQHPDCFKDLEDLNEKVCGKAATKLIARIGGEFPYGTLAEDMSGAREFTITCAPTVGAMTPAQLSLFLAGLTEGFWMPAAHGSAWSAGDCYGFCPPV